MTHNNDNTIHIKTFWDFPWGFSQAFLLTFGIFINGLAIQLASKVSQLQIPEHPFSVIFMCTFWCCITLLAWLGQKSKLIQWLGSVSLSIASLSFVGIMATLAALIPQQNHATNWTQNITASWPFALLILLMLTNLGIATTLRLFQFKWRDLGFFCNHFGLWLALAAMAFGTGDLKRLRLKLQKNQSANIAFDYQSIKGEEPLRLPFSIKLLAFQMEEYQSGEAKYFASQLEITSNINTKNTHTVEVNNPIELKQWHIYQASYEGKPNEDSLISILELVYDPWLPVVHLGGILMLAGSAFLFFTGFKKHKGT